MKATRLAPWILIACCLAWGLIPAFAIGEHFEGGVMVNQRPRAVDSASEATLLTGMNTVSQNSIIKGTHFLLLDGNIRIAGGTWIGVTEYIGYVRTPSQEGRCYLATFDAYYPPDPNVFGIWGSPIVCVPEHSMDCGHCGPGTGNPCTLDTEEIPE
ncbi:MAG: hypothetical protein ABJC13_23905 [Acidobacteriota bacterium]